MFSLTLRPEPGIDATKALRGALKTLRRKFGLRCTTVREYNRATMLTTDEQVQILTEVAQRIPVEKTRPAVGENSGTHAVQVAD